MQKEVSWLSQLIPNRGYAATLWTDVGWSWQIFLIQAKKKKRNKLSVFFHRETSSLQLLLEENSTFLGWWNCSVLISVSDETSLVIHFLLLHKEGGWKWFTQWLQRILQQWWHFQGNALFVSVFQLMGGTATNKFGQCRSAKTPEWFIASSVQWE